MPEATGAKADVLSSFSMQRLDYRLEEFTRHSWANDEAKVVWEPRIRKVCACLAELEWRSILEGVRACALTSVAPDELEAFGAMLATSWADRGPSGKGCRSRQCTLIPCKTPREGEPFHYWCAIGRVSDVQLFESAYLSHDDEAIGRLLGYPSCCIDFFNRVWVDEGFIDTTWPMAQNTAKKRIISPTHLEITEVSNCNHVVKMAGAENRHPPALQFRLSADRRTGRQVHRGRKVRGISSGNGLAGRDVELARRVDGLERTC